MIGGCSERKRLRCQEPARCGRRWNFSSHCNEPVAPLPPRKDLTRRGLSDTYLPTNRKLKEKLCFSSEWRPFLCCACCSLFALIPRNFRAIPKSIGNSMQHERDMEAS